MTGITSRFSWLKAHWPRLLGARDADERVELLLQGLATSNRRRSSAAIETLVAIGHEAVQPLLGALRESYSWPPTIGQRLICLRANVIEALGCIRDPRAIDELLAAATDEDPLVRSYAIVALEQFDDRRCEAALHAALCDSRQSVCTCARKALQRVEQRKAA